MLLRARDELGLDLACSILIGDKASDIAGAKAEGVGLAVLLEADGENATPDRVVASLHEACEFLFSRELA
jgi:D-glycero-D-manno-heptose 1,7-bisphosphate phosphatase